MRRYDVLVIGAGPAGATTALRLARAGASVIVVEKAPFPRRKVCGEYISATAWPLLLELGVARLLEGHAGPAVERVGLFAGEVTVESPMPRPHGAVPWGRAVGRHLLDAALLDAAQSAGAHVRQPAKVTGLAQEATLHRIAIECGSGRAEEIIARMVVDAHGSWERTPGASSGPPCRPSDLLGFKARFGDARLAPGLMPLVLFPGGYGGLVQSDSSSVSFSCCIRRDVLRRIRAAHATAGDAVLAHVVRHCRGVRECLAGARQEGAWLAAGPIRPGIRKLHEGARFAVGNAAGEAHPLVAEGIAMAMQSAWLLSDELGASDLSDRGLAITGRRYARRWRRQLAARVWASRSFAALTMPSTGAALSVAVLSRMPIALSLGARWSGKARSLSASGA